MTRARALLVLLALLPACITFSDPTSYVCSDDSGCPSGWTCDGTRCSKPGGSGDLGAACFGACTELFDCGFAASCQADSSCNYAFMFYSDAGSCAAACSEDSEGLSASQLDCISRGDCDTTEYDRCLGL